MSRISDLSHKAQQESFDYYKACKDYVQLFRDDPPTAAYGNWRYACGRKRAYDAATAHFGKLVRACTTAHDVLSKHKGRKECEAVDLIEQAIQITSSEDEFAFWKENAGIAFSNDWYKNRVE